MEPFLYHRSFARASFFQCCGLCKLYTLVGHWTSVFYLIQRTDPSTLITTLRSRRGGKNVLFWMQCLLHLATWGGGGLGQPQHFFPLLLFVCFCLFVCFLNDADSCFSGGAFTILSDFAPWLIHYLMLMGYGQGGFCMNEGQNPLKSGCKDKNCKPVILCWNDNIVYECKWTAQMFTRNLKPLASLL